MDTEVLKCEEIKNLIKKLKNNIVVELLKKSK